MAPSPTLTRRPRHAARIAVGMIIAIITQAFILLNFLLRSLPDFHDDRSSKSAATASDAGNCGRCPRHVSAFGEGSDFFTPEGYTRWVDCWNMRNGFTDASEVRPLHIVFEPLVKTHFVSAYPAMMDLASRPDVRVTLLGVRGKAIVRKEDGEVVIIHSDSEILPGDRVVRDLSLPAAALNKLRMAGISIIQINATRFNEDKVESWMKALQAADISPIDFVVADCKTWTNSADLLLARVLVPGALWCCSYPDVERKVFQSFVKKVTKAVGQRVRQHSLSFTSSAVSSPGRGIPTAFVPFHIFCSDFLGFGNRGIGPRKVKITHSKFANLNLTARIETRLVSIHPAQTPEFSQNFNDVAAEEVQELQREMLRLGKDKLVYVAFGSQGFRFKRDTIEIIIDQVRSVDGAYIYLVVPEASDWTESPKEWTIEEWKKQYWGVPLPDHVHVTKFSDQLGLFQQFGCMHFPRDLSKYNDSDGTTDITYISHGGGASLVEAVGYGVPVVCLPFLWDQPMNCESIEKAGLGLNMQDMSRKFLDNGMIEPPIATLKGKHTKFFRKSLLTQAPNVTLEEALQVVAKQRSIFMSNFSDALLRLKRSSYDQKEVGDVLYKVAQNLTKAASQWGFTHIPRSTTV